MESFTLTLSGSSVVSNGTTFAVTDASGTEVIYSTSISPTVAEVDVKMTDGSETVTEPVETPAVETAEDAAPAA